MNPQRLSLGTQKGKRIEANSKHHRTTNSGNTFTRTRGYMRSFQSCQTTQVIGCCNAERRKAKPSSSQIQNNLRQVCMVCMYGERCARSLSNSTTKSGRLRVESVTTVTQHDHQSGRKKQRDLKSVASASQHPCKSVMSCNPRPGSYQGPKERGYNWKEWHPPARQIAVDRCISCVLRRSWSLPVARRRTVVGPATNYKYSVCSTEQGSKKRNSTEMTV